MVTKTEKVYFGYIVSLPQLKLPNLKNIKNVEAIISTSDRGAVSHTLAHKIPDKVDRTLKGKTIRNAMRQLDNDFGGAENYAYEIQLELTENGVTISQSNPRYRLAQESFLAEEIARKTGGGDAKTFLKIAQQYLNIYNSYNLQNQ